MTGHTADQGLPVESHMQQCLTAGAGPVALLGGQKDGRAHIELHCPSARAAVSIGHSAGDCDSGSRAGGVRRQGLCDGGRRRADVDGGRARGARRRRATCCRVETASTVSP